VEAAVPLIAELLVDFNSIASVKNV